MLLNTKEEREKFIKDVLNEVYVNAIDHFKKDFATKQNLYMFFVNEISEEFKSKPELFNVVAGWFPKTLNLPEFTVITAVGLEITTGALLSIKSYQVIG